MPEMRATPQNPWWGVPANLLKKGLDFAEAPFGYPNPPVKLINQALGLPGTQRTLEKLSYGEPILGPTNTPLISDDLLDAAGIGLAGVAAAAPSIMKAATKVPKMLATAGADRPMRVPNLAQVGAVGDVWPPGMLSVSGNPGIGTLRKADRYSTKALDALPQEQSTFSPQVIRDQLNKPGVAAADKALFQEILQENPGKQISADTVANAFDSKVERLRLNPNVRRIADDPAGEDGLIAYGLHRIGQGPHKSNLTLYEFEDPHGIPTTHGFGPKYFGHTRGFEKDGVGHTVEVQSDLAQLKPAERAAMDPESRAFIQDSITPGLEMPPDLVKALAQDEQRKAMAPLMKNYPKRLIDETLRTAAESGAPAHRFATADTMAKVEGWPSANPLRDAQAQLAGIQSEQQRLLAVYERRRGNAEFSDTLPELEDTLRRNKAEFERIKAELPTLKDETSFDPSVQGIYKRHKAEVDEFLLKHKGGRPYTDAKGHSWIEVPLGDGSGKVQLYSLGPAGLAAGPILDQSQFGSEK